MGSFSAIRAKINPISGTPFVPTPIIVLSANVIAEDSAEDTAVGTFSVVNGSGSYTFALDASYTAGQFKITGADLVAGDVVTDFETATSLVVPVVATGTGSPTGNFTILVTDLSEAPNPPGDIADLAAVAGGATSVQLTFTPAVNAVSHEYSRDLGTWSALSPGNIVTGLTASTLYSFRVRGVSDLDIRGNASNAATATTDSGIVTPGSIADLTGTVLGATSIQLAFTNAANSTSSQYSFNGTTWTALASNKILTGLTPSTTYSAIRVRGINSGANGPASNTISKTTSGSGAFNPVTSILQPDLVSMVSEGLLLESERLAWVAEISARGASISTTNTWGVAGEPNLSYRDATYDTSGAGIPGTALDISAYSGVVSTWLAAMEAQGKPGKAGSGTYSAAGLTTIGTQSIYGYGATRPVFTGDWKHYVQANNVRFQYLKRTNSPLWIIVQDGTDVITGGASSSINNNPANPAKKFNSFWTTSRTYYSFMKGAAAQHKKAANLSGLRILDCHFDNVEHAFAFDYGIGVGPWNGNIPTTKYRLSDVAIGRNTYTNGCITIGSGDAVYFGDGVTGVDPALGLRFYGNSISGGYFKNFSSIWASLVAVQSSNDLNAAAWAGPPGIYGLPADGFTSSRSGPIYIDCNEATDMVAAIMPKTDDNMATCFDARETDAIFIRWNICKNVYSDFYPSDCQAVYCKGTAKVYENYFRGCGAGADNGTMLADVWDNDGSNPGEVQGGEASQYIFKGGGGTPSNRSLMGNSILIPRWTDTAVMMNLHTGEISGNIIIGWKGLSGVAKHAKAIDHNSGNDEVVFGNYWIGTGTGTRAMMGQHLISSKSTLPGCQTAGTIVNFDNNRTDCLHLVATVGNAQTVTGLQLTNDSALFPRTVTRPTITYNGTIFTATAGVYGHGDTANTPTAATMASVVKSWKRGAVMNPVNWRITGGTTISGQTGSTLAAAQFTDTIEYVETVTDTNGRVITVHSLPWFKPTGSELATVVSAVGAGWSGTIASMVHSANTATSTFDVNVGSLTAGATYAIRFIRSGSSSGSGKVVIIGGGRVVPLFLSPNARNYWIKTFLALSGENIIRFSGGNPGGSTCTISGISVTKIS